MVHEFYASRTVSPHSSVSFRIIQYFVLVFHTIHNFVGFDVRFCTCVGPWKYTIVDFFHPTRMVYINLWWFLPNCLEWMACRIFIAVNGIAIHTAYMCGSSRHLVVYYFRGDATCVCKLWSFVYYRSIRGIQAWVHESLVIYFNRYFN